MQTISVKKLRDNFPKVRNQLKKGEILILVYQNLPIAKLTPIKNFNFQIKIDEEGLSEKEVEQTAINDLDHDYLSKEEIDYYLSLKDIK